MAHKLAEDCEDAATAGELEIFIDGATAFGFCPKPRVSDRWGGA
jgi:hypothetical protein